ncbi:MAG: hypothetical protein AB7P99_16740 [Vicinamibacterales bacterium]
MATALRPDTSTVVETGGAAMAAILGGGIGAFAMGAFVVLNEAGLFAAPTLYGPAGGVSGRTTFAVITWLIGWAVLHARWKGRDDIAPGPILAWTVVLIVAGLVATFPPVWGLLG